MLSILVTAGLCFAAEPAADGSTAPAAADPETLPLPPELPARHPNGLLIAGVAVLATGYTPPLIWASLSAGFQATSGNRDGLKSGLGFVPVAGPFVWEAMDVGGLADSGVGGIVVIDGIVQAAGAGLIIGGIATHHPVSWVPSVHVGRGVELGVAGRF